MTNKNVLCWCKAGRFWQNHQIEDKMEGGIRQLKERRKEKQIWLYTYSVNEMQVMRDRERVMKRKSDIYFSLLTKFERKWGRGRWTDGSNKQNTIKEATKILRKYINDWGVKIKAGEGEYVNNTHSGTQLEENTRDNPPDKRHSHADTRNISK